MLTAKSKLADLEETLKLLQQNTTAKNVSPDLPKSPEVRACKLLLYAICCIYTALAIYSSRCNGMVRAHVRVCN